MFYTKNTVFVTNFCKLFKTHILFRNNKAGLSQDIFYTPIQIFHRLIFLAVMNAIISNAWIKILVLTNKE